MPETRNVPKAALCFHIGECEFASNGEGSKTAPVKMVARSGKPVQHWYWGKVVHDLSGMRLSKPKLPIDYCHNSDEVLGYLNKFDTSSGDLVCSGAVTPFKPDDRASEVLFKNKEGVPYEASIFFDPRAGLRIEEFGPGATAVVNGQTFEGPGIVIRQWTLRGVAICPYGQDPNTSTQFRESDTINVTVFKQETQTMSQQQNNPAEAGKTTTTTTSTPAVDANKTTLTVQTEAGKPAVDGAAAGKPAEGQQQQAAATQLSSQPQPAAGTVEAPKPQGNAEAAKFVTAFGDIGARWFIEGKPFDQAATEFIGKLKTDHAAEIDRLNAQFKTEREGLQKQIQDLQTKLAAAPRGADSASFQAEKPGDPKVAQLTANVGPATAKVAAAIKFADAPAK